MPMDPTLVLANLLDPPILFFFAGLLAVWLGSDLDIPQPLPKLFSLYLLLSIGFKGGVELSHGLEPHAALALAAAVGMAVAVPLYVYLLLCRRLGSANAAGVAATYGSVSAVTFIAATSFLEQLGIPFGGHMVAALALMESPAIIVAVAMHRRSGGAGHGEGWRAVLKEALLNGSVYLLMASVLIGFLSGERGAAVMQPFTGALFKGVLCLFLLDMGLVSARRLREARSFGVLPFSVAFAVPLANAALAIALAALISMTPGDAFLFCVLCASASYIAVPAALRLSVPEANPGLYVTLSLGITFPFNIVVGLPLYLTVIRRLWE